MYLGSGFVFICLTITLGYAIGLLFFLSDHEENKCEMTYMFEYPQFVRISSKVDNQFPRYNLYAYGEGRFTSKARNMFFDGIPVLFIPGNAGSYKQVRSLSSIALRKAISSKTSFHFDYFTVDLNDEYSGLYGALLMDQLRYINSSIHRILKLYNKRKTGPTSVVIVGHSMGGVIARKLISNLPNPSLVSILITLAAPLKRSAVVFDYHIHNFYANNWNLPESVTFISLSGGYRDFLIPPYLTEIKANNTLQVVTTNIPLSWVEADHVEIIWCKQTVLALSRALFDSVDVKTKQISSNITFRNLVFNHHLVHHSGTKVQNRKNYFESVKLDHKGQWIESILRQYSVQFLQGVGQTHWYMVRLSNLPDHEILTVLGINLEVVNWIFTCNAYYPLSTSRVCIEANHLTHFSEIAPSIRNKRRFIQINMHDLKKNNSELTHVILKILPTHEPVTFHVDVHKYSERTIAVNLPNWWSLQKTVILESSVEKALHYDLLLPQLEHIIQFYQLYIEPFSCSIRYHHASISLIVPWGHENQHFYVTDSERKPINIRLYSSKPNSVSSESAVIRLTLDPSCRYKISIKGSIPGVLGQMARSYTSLLLANMAIVILMILKSQMKSFRLRKGPSLLEAIKESMKPFYILVFAKVLSLLTSNTTLIGYLPQSDWHYLEDDNTDFFLLPFLAYLCSVGIVWLFAVSLLISLVTLESTIHKLALKFLARSVSFTVAWSDSLLSALHKVPLMVVATLIFLCVSTCGSLALCVGAIFYFLKLTQMSQDFIEEVLWSFVKSFAKKCRNLFKKSKSEVTLKEKNEVSIVLEKKLAKNKENPVVTEEISESELDETDIETVESEDDALNEMSELNDIVGKIDEIKEQTEYKEDEQTMPVGENDKITKDLYTERDLQQERESENKIKKESDLSESYTSLFFHATLFFIWCVISVINIPVVLTWAHNFKHSRMLMPDSSFIPGFVLSICAFPLWQFDLPKTNRKGFDKLETFIMMVTVLSLIYGTISLYRLNYLLTLTILIITLHQLFAPKIQIMVEETNEAEEKEQRIRYENFKKKND